MKHLLILFFLSFFLVATMLFISVTFVVRWGNVIYLGFNYSFHVKISFFRHRYLTRDYLFLEVTKWIYMHCRFLQGELCSVISFYPRVIIYKNIHIIFSSIRKLTYRERKWFFRCSYVGAVEQELRSAGVSMILQPSLEGFTEGWSPKITWCYRERKKGMCPGKPQLCLLSNDVYIALRESPCLRSPLPLDQSSLSKCL